MQTGASSRWISFYKKTHLWAQGTILKESKFWLICCQRSCHYENFFNAQHVTKLNPGKLNLLDKCKVFDIISISVYGSSVGKTCLLDYKRKYQ